MAMRDLICTDDPVLVSFVEFLLKEAQIGVEVFDRNLNALHGAVGPAPQRVVVASKDWDRARRLLADADLGHWLVEGGS